MAEQAHWENVGGYDAEDVGGESFLTAKDRAFFLSLPGGFKILGLDAEEALIVEANLNQSTSSGSDWA